MKKLGITLLLLSLAMPAMAQEADSTAAAPVTADSTAAVPADSVAAAPAPVDSAAAAPADSVAVPADTAKAPADTVKKDTAAVAKADSAAAPADSAKAAPAEPAATPAPRKRFFFGVFGAATYNDLYDSKLGLSSLDKDASGYSVKTAGQDELMGNYWGVGANVGLSAMFMFTEMFGIHGEIGAAYRKGQGESDVVVILTWDDETKMKERAALGITYSLKQVNLDIPLFFRFAYPNIMYVEAGPMLSLSLYSRDKSYIETDGRKRGYRQEDVCDLTEFDLAFGIGVTRPIGSKTLEAGLRFVLGMTRLNDADDAPKTWQGQFNLTFWFL